MQLSRLGEFTLLLVATLTIMVGAVVAPGLNSIASALDFDAHAPLLITLPALGAILFAPLFGKLIDAIGARTTLLWSLLGYFVLGAGGMLIYGPVMVIADRILLGGFAVGTMAAGTALISQWYTGKARLSMIARQGMAIEFGGVVFLFFGGHLSEMSWRVPFMLYALAFICVLLTLLTVPKRNPDAASSGATPPAGKARSIGPVMIYTVLAMSLFFTLFTTLPGLLADFRFTETQTGYLLSLISLVAVFTAMVMPKVVGRFSENTTLMLGFVSFACAHILFAISTMPQMLILAALCAGIGFGFTIPLLNHATVERSTDQNRGKNLSLFGIAVFSGQFMTSFFEFVPLPVSETLLACAGVGILCAIQLKARNSLATA
ncbi:MFS transporter [Marinobacter sp. F3R08]|uniref:MFS transporter n=1 Tax=Marinobacter sp. F3R08 TaxID=2841559 RepID=UPI001C09B68E|nr:MFS transporter [Marinobacter sp. F3R08]MBU2955935.1 MFS transporter [Marinobacter sp. F3R08]